jgi:hypothetical protein
MTISSIARITLLSYAKELNIICTMCSVLQSPIPCAPFFLAVIASSGVSAFAKT